MATIIPQLLGFLELITPFAQIIVLYVIPIYISIGTAFAKFGEIFVNWLSGDTALFPIIIAGVMLVLGLLGGFLSKTKEEKEEIQKQKASEKNGSTPASNYEF